MYMHVYVYLRCTSSFPTKQDFEHNVLDYKSLVLTGSSSMGYTRSLLLRVWKLIQAKPRKHK